MRLIDADELKTAFPICDNSKPVLVACIRATINHMPTIVPKKGKWVCISGYGWGETWICSECGEWTIRTAVGKPMCKYCPNCGADMIEGNPR